MATALTPLALVRRPAPPKTATTLDYLARAGDTFVAALDLYSTRPSADAHQRAGRLADLAWRCAERAGRTATGPTDLERALATQDIADRTHALATALGAHRSTPGQD